MIFAGLTAPRVSDQQLFTSYDIAGNLGDCELRLGQARDAAEHLSFALRDFPPTGKSALRKQIEERYAEARKLVGALRVRVSAAEALVSINGRPVGRSPLKDEVFVEPGDARVEASLEGHRSAVRSVSIGRGEAQDVALVLVQESPGPSIPVVVASGTVAGVLVITGIALVPAANAKVADADAQRGAIVGKGGQCKPPTAFEAECAALKGAYEEADTLTNAAIGALVSGGLLGATTALYALWPRKGGEAQTSARVDVIVAKDHGGVVVRGVW